MYADIKPHKSHFAEIRWPVVVPITRRWHARSAGNFAKAPKPKRVRHTQSPRQFLPFPARFCACHGKPTGPTARLESVSRSLFALLRHVPAGTAVCFPKLLAGPTG